MQIVNLLNDRVWQPFWVLWEKYTLEFPISSTVLICNMLGFFFWFVNFEFRHNIWLISLDLLRLNKLMYFCSIHCRGEGKKTADCLRTALRDYNLKFSTILNDPDLASFRALPEFRELQEEVNIVIVIVLSFFCVNSIEGSLHFFSWFYHFSWFLIVYRLELEVKMSDMDFEGISSLSVRFKHHFVV